MNNDQTIVILRDILRELEARLRQLMQVRKRPGGPIDERVDRQMQIFERISSLNIRIYHLQVRLHERELARSLNEAVSPLSALRAHAMQAALADAGRDLSATNTFKALIALASKISNSASAAADAATKD